MTYRLREVRTPEDWAALHSIRRTVLFAPGRRSTDYDDKHPDDRLPNHRPFLLMSGDEAVGVARLDRYDTMGIVRMVAISPSKQRMGLGRVLGDLLDAEARRAGIVTLRVSANTDAVGFYEKTGWRRSKGVALSTGSVRMEKEI